MSWKKFDKNKPPKVKRFIAIISGYVKAIAKIVKPYKGQYYITEFGKVIRPDEIQWWTELPGFNEEYQYKGKTLTMEKIECK